MASDTLPPGAYQAACAAGIGAPDPVLAGLLAAAPLIRADERERIRQLAVGEAQKLLDETEVWSSIASAALEDFADLLGGPS